MKKKVVGVKKFCIFAIPNNGSAGVDDLRV
ncbi:hypothetical protein J2780_003769, partial [Chryseobacterium camelliae]|nr:hypothetical protein [Chryseobacterium camelliae]